MRSKLGIGAQAVAVAALGAIVYLAFLSPNDSGPLTGIDAGPPLEQPPREEHATKHKKAGPRPARPRLVTTAEGVRLPASVVPSVDDEPVDSPAGSQYAGTVARILGEVARARP